MNEYLNDNWTFLACGHCKFWGKDCKRIDHEHLPRNAINPPALAMGSFKEYAEGNNGQ